ncbi:M48 family metalloprotease [Halodesulfovibrio aestuarii]|uniref:Peptidase M48 domain-containing protein n=1 Tax=Halodesulfovibrio aestuarii TaxID=126333 RepID=A0A8G2CCC0_9BACT|nr:M48 family metalloprotease [Halodesulfovibrio aestuarii]SHJ76807.1 hypothetical protein SAMN05660830_03177 [Halodesulfovibrio aestuarii]
MSRAALTYEQIMGDEKAMLRDTALDLEDGPHQEIIKLMVLLTNEIFFETHHGYLPSDNKPAGDLPDDNELADYVRRATPFDHFEYEDIKIPIVAEDTYLGNVKYSLDCITGCIVALPPATIVVNSYSKDHTDSAEFKSLLCHEAGHLLGGHTTSRSPIADYSNISQEVLDEINNSEQPELFLYYHAMATCALNGGYENREMEANIIAYKIYHELNYHDKYGCDFLTAQERLNTHQSISTKTRMMTKNMVAELRKYEHNELIEKANSLLI